MNSELPISPSAISAQSAVKKSARWGVSHVARFESPAGSATLPYSEEILRILGKPGLAFQRYVTGDLRLSIAPLLRPAVVDFDHPDASAVVHSGKQRGIETRGQRDGYSGFQRAGGRESCRD
jgi:hypothetical protein